MKKNKIIKARLYLPKECYSTFENRFEEFKNEMECCWEHEFNICLAEYNDKEVCLIEVILYDTTFKSVTTDYSQFKKYIKEFTGKQPKQLLMFKLERV